MSRPSAVDFRRRCSSSCWYTPTRGRLSHAVHAPDPFVRGSTAGTCSPRPSRARCTRHTARSPRRSRPRARSSPATQLAAAADATTVRVRDGETLVTDGPFAETKEQLGGYYLIEAESLDEAIEWAVADPRRAVRHDRGAAGRDAVGRGRPDSTSSSRVFRDERAVCSRPRSASSATSSLPRTRCRTRSRAALERWPRDGTPAGPAPGSSTVARNAAIDRIRRAGRSSARPSCSRRAEAAEDEDVDTLPDERLAPDLHVLPPGARVDAQVALTLQAVGGADAAEVPARFLVPGRDHGATARARQAQDPRGRDPVPRPPDHLLPERLRSPCSQPSTSSSTRATARRFATSSATRRCGSREAACRADAGRGRGARAGALMLLQDAPRGAPGEALVLLDDQDHALGSAGIEEGRRLLDRALRSAGRARTSSRPRSRRSTGGGDRLARDRRALRPSCSSVAPSPVVELNRAVAVALADGRRRASR